MVDQCLPVRARRAASRPTCRSLHRLIGDADRLVGECPCLGEGREPTLDVDVLGDLVGIPHDRGSFKFHPCASSLETVRYSAARAPHSHGLAAVHDGKSVVAVFWLSALER